MKLSKMLQNISPRDVQIKKDVSYYVIGSYIGETPIHKTVKYCNECDYNNGFMFSGKGFNWSKRIVTSSAWKMI